MPDGPLFEGEPQVHVVVPDHRISRGALAALVVTAALGVFATGVIHAAPASADPTPSCNTTTCTVSFGTAGTTQQWSVPAGVSTITVAMAGGSGGSSSAGGVGGAGGAMVATVPVSSGENLSILQGTSPFPGGDFGGGGAPGAGGPGQTGGWGGGGSFVFETNPTATLLLAVGGGGGAGGDAGEVAGTGGTSGPGTDATSTFDPTVVGLGGTLAAGGGGGAGTEGPTANGLAGGGPAMAPSNPGAGGSGGSSNFPPPPPTESSGGGGGGGYFGGGGGGVSDPLGVFSGAGGGGSGFNDPSTTVLSNATNTGDGSVTITYPVPATTTTSGVLLDAATGTAIPNSCVVFSPAAFPGRTNYDSVGGDGTWSFTTAESGPFDLAFYTTSNGDCSQPILPTPVPSWYINQPLSGTDEHVITPPPGATTVAAGASGIVACLGATALPTAACATPQVVLSGHVDTTGPVPLANVCVFVVDASGNGGQAMTDAQGNWSVSGLPAGFNVVVIFVPFFSGTKGPCKGSGGGPPVPGPGQLQPVFYGNVWANLADPTFLNDPYTWGVPRGAITLSAPTANVDACITNAAGTVVPRPSCTPSAAVVAANASTTPAATAPNASPLLAFTGATFLPLVTIGSGLLLAGLALLVISSTGRRRWLQSHLRTSSVPLRHTSRHTGPLSRVKIPSSLQRSRRQVQR
jgi:hypothetical protein